MIYLDNAATSFYKPLIVKKNVCESVNKFTANPGRSGHMASCQTAEKVFETRERVKHFFNAEGYDVIFTKNCTEALNLAIFGTLKSGDHVITTCYEHNSVLRPLEKLKQAGVEVTIVEDDLSLVQNSIERNIKPNTRMVITTMVSNVTGEIANVNAISKLCKKNHLIYLIDGAQSSGHSIIDLKKIDVDMYAFAGHKGLLSITGVGGLIVKDISKLTPIILGGTGTSSANLDQPSDTIEGFESGTIPVIPILSLNSGIEFLERNFEKIVKYEENLSKYLYCKLKKLIFLEIYSKECSQNVFSFNVANYDSMQMANILNSDYGICVRSGLHCAPLIHKKLGTLERGAVRVSIDFRNTKQEIDYLIKALKEINI